MYRTGHGIPMEFDNIPDALLSFYERTKHYDSNMSIIIGTDSQSFNSVNDTKVANVIAAVCDGHGGIFFYEVTHIGLLHSVKEKLQTETAESLMIAEKLVTAFESDEKYSGMYLNCPISIHVDAGNSEKGKTRLLIPEIVGWVRNSGYDVCVKPESYVASCIADKFSK